MSGNGTFLILNGSPKGERSTSASLGAYLAAHGLQGEVARILPALRAPEGQAALLQAAGRAGLLVLAEPLYVDSLPAPVTRFLELYAAARRDGGPPGQRLAAIINCGFPEAHHCDTALAILACFAAAAGLTFTGGLALGGGGALDGKPLERAGGMARNVRRALDLAAGRPLGEEAIRLMRQPLMPAWLYRLGGNWGWRQQARRHGAHQRLDAQPWA